MNREAGLTIIGGRDKDGGPEPVAKVDILPGESVALVGATGSGKSRLLADVEWLSGGDSPSGRKIILHAEPKGQGEATVGSIVRLSQSMSYHMDMSVGAFLRVYFESADCGVCSDAVEKTLALANELSGEGFHRDTDLTSLSGGQARALMIAEATYFQNAVVVLIDEIENAGIDRLRAMDILAREKRIMIVATHDPLIALKASRRISFANGAMTNIISTSSAEKSLMEKLEAEDRVLDALRIKLREGKPLCERLQQ